MPPTSPAPPQQQIAVFIDFENIALGLRDGTAPFDARPCSSDCSRRESDRQGRVCGLERFRNYTASLHENGIALTEIPRRSTTGKNSADIRLVVDAMDLSWSKPHIDTFVIVSGDSDFSPLVSKLKENGKHVIGLGMKESTSPLLANSCDEFIYYERLERGANHAEPDDRPRGRRRSVPAARRDVRALQRENYEVLQASLVKDTMKRSARRSARPRSATAASARCSKRRRRPRHHAAERRAQRHLRRDGVRAIGSPGRRRTGPRALTG
jgi:hypothetical protein